jgi:uncharacterized DUF497 family protein
MRFEWDENKRRRNVEERGLDFLRATEMFDGRPVFTYHSPRGSEDRWGSVGRLTVDGEEDFYLVVWTRRGEATRIISFYRADDWEIRAYRQLHG